MGSDLVARSETAVNLPKAVDCGQPTGAIPSFAG